MVERPLGRFDLTAVVPVGRLFGVVVAVDATLNVGAQQVDGSDAVLVSLAGAELLARVVAERALVEAAEADGLAVDVLHGLAQALDAIAGAGLLGRGRLLLLGDALARIQLGRRRRLAPWRRRHGVDMVGVDGLLAAVAAAAAAGGARGRAVPSTAARARAAGRALAIVDVVGVVPLPVVAVAIVATIAVTTTMVVRAAVVPAAALATVPSAAVAAVVPLVPAWVAPTAVVSSAVASTVAVVDLVAAGGTVGRVAAGAVGSVARLVLFRRGGGCRLDFGLARVALLDVHGPAASFLAGVLVVAVTAFEEID